MRSVIITGAAGGMGRAAALLFARNGFRVFALDITAQEPSENIIPITTDITDEASLLRAFKHVRSVSGEIHAIIHFAGVYMLDSLAEMPADDFRRIFDINLTGAFLVNRTFMPLLSKGSRILIITSELAPLAPLPFTGVYAVSKCALDRYAYSLRMELQLLDIQVSVLRAGAVDTGMLGASTRALDRFCEKTRLYTCSADRFRKIVAGVEARCIPPEKVAAKAFAIVSKKKPSFAHAINRNPLLLILNLLPKSLQLKIIPLLIR